MTPRTNVPSLDSCAAGNLCPLPRYAGRDGQQYGWNYAGLCLETRGEQFLETVDSGKASEFGFARSVAVARMPHPYGQEQMVLSRPGRRYQGGMSYDILGGTAADRKFLGIPDSTATETNGLRRGGGA